VKKKIESACKGKVTGEETKSEKQGNGVPVQVLALVILGEPLPLSEPPVLVGPLPRQLPPPAQAQHLPTQEGLNRENNNNKKKRKRKKG
jgi:hypothetical protein